MWQWEIEELLGLPSTVAKSAKPSDVRRALKHLRVEEEKLKEFVTQTVNLLDPHKRFPKEMRELLVYVLQRQTKTQAARTGHGYALALYDVGEDYQRALKEKIVNVLGCVAMMENIGLHYDSHLDSIELIVKLWKMAEEGWLQSTHKPIPGVDQRTLAIGDALDILADDLRKHGIDVCQPQVILLALDIMRAAGAKSVLHAVDMEWADNHALIRHMNVGDYLAFANKLARTGMTEKVLRSIFIKSRDRPGHVYVTTRLLEENVFSPEVIKTVACTPRVFRRIEFDTIVQHARAWHAAGRPCPFLQWVEYGPPQPKVERPSVVAAPVMVKPQALQPPPPSQEPTGHKRYHPNYKAAEKETPEINWQMVLDHLKVDDLLPGLNESLVRAILVHGILREGDRFAGATREAKDKTLVKAVRKHADARERDIIRALDALVKAHVLLYKGGFYRLATPTDLHPKARDLIARLRAIAATLPT